MLEIVGTVAAVYLAIVAGLYLLQRHLIYLPFGGVPNPVQAGVPEMHPVRLTTGDGLKLLAWWRAPQRPDLPVLVYFHGNAGNLGLRGEKLRPYLDAGLGVLLLAYRGFSGNPGSPSEEGLYRDARAALDFVAAAGIPAEQRVLYGESLGTGVAVQMAVEQPVGAVVLEAPYSSISDVASARYPVVPVRWLLKDRFDSAAKVAQIAVPLLIIAGGRDRIVPARFVERLFAAAAEPKEYRYIPEATHLDFYDHGAPVTVLDFLQRHLAPAHARRATP